MNSDVTLDLFRGNQLSYMLCWIKYTDIGICIPFTYSDYLNNALDNFIMTLRRLENTFIVPIAYNPELLSIFVDLFSAMEQFISTTYIIAYLSIRSAILPSTKEANKLFRQDYTKTLNMLSDLIACDEIAKRENSEVLRKVAELEYCRNYIVHGNVGKVKIKYSQLPTSPLTINYEDIMEELDIIINLVNRFRYIFPNIDLMPNIRIAIGGTVLYKKLDDYYYKFLVPYISTILKKHSLKSTKEYALCTTSFVPNINYICQEISIIIKLISESKFGYNMNKEQTDYCSRGIIDFIGANNINKLIADKKFEVPKFMIS